MSLRGRCNPVLHHDLGEDVREVALASFGLMGRWRAMSVLIRRWPTRASTSCRHLRSGSEVPSQGAPMGAPLRRKRRAVHGAADRPDRQAAGLKEVNMSEQHTEPTADPRDSSADLDVPAFAIDESPPTSPQSKP